MSTILDRPFKSNGTIGLRNRIKRGGAALMVSMLIGEPIASESGLQEFSYPGGVAQMLIPKNSANLPTVRYGLREPAILERDTHWHVLLGIGLKQLPGDYVLYVRQFGEDEAAEFRKFQVTHKFYKVSDETTLAFEALPEGEELTTLGFNNSQPPSIPMQQPFSANWDSDYGQQFINSENNSVKVQNYTFAETAVNTLIRAPQAGIVSNITDFNDNKTVMLDHGRGIFSVIHNINDLSVELGNGVSAGTVIGKASANPRSDSTSARAINTNDTRTVTVYWQVQLNNVFINPLIMTKL